MVWNSFPVRPRRSWPAPLIWWQRRAAVTDLSGCNSAPDGAFSPVCLFAVVAHEVRIKLNSFTYLWLVSHFHFIQGSFDPTPDLDYFSPSFGGDHGWVETSAQFFSLLPGSQ